MGDRKKLPGDIKKNLIIYITQSECGRRSVNIWVEEVAPHS